MKTSTTRGAFVLSLSLIIVVATGCVDEDPIVQGKRPDAGAVTPDGGAAISTVVPSADTADEDLPECRHCAETLDTNNSRGTLCRKNVVSGGLSSVRLLNALVDCVCYDQCIDECQNYCSGSKTTATCQLCIGGKCDAPLSACYGDVK